MEVGIPDYSHNLEFTHTRFLKKVFTFLNSSKKIPISGCKATLMI